MTIILVSLVLAVLVIVTASLLSPTKVEYTEEILIDARIEDIYDDIYRNT